MIELGRLRIETEASIVDARSKIGALARSLGFDVVTVARMAALVSEMCRKARENHEHFHLDIALDQRESRDGLALIFRDCTGPQLSALASIGFDMVQERHGSDDVINLFAFKRLTNAGFEISDEIVAQARDRNRPAFQGRSTASGYLAWRHCRRTDGKGFNSEPAA